VRGKEKGHNKAPSRLTSRAWISSYWILKPTSRPTEMATVIPVPRRTLTVTIADKGGWRDVERRLAGSCYCSFHSASRRVAQRCPESDWSRVHRRGERRGKCGGPLMSRRLFETGWVFWRFSLPLPNHFHFPPSFLPPPPPPPPPPTASRRRVCVCVRACGGSPCRLLRANHSRANKDPDPSGLVLHFLFPLRRLDAGVPAAARSGPPVRSLFCYRGGERRAPPSPHAPQDSRGRAPDG
jgi:hypothetical protein